MFLFNGWHRQWRNPTPFFPSVFYARWLLCCGVVFGSIGLSHAAHGYAQFGDMKYAPGFSHFEWVNPQAPKGGDFSLVPPSRSTNFDKFNPFTLKGTAPPGLHALVFETLLASTVDEPTTAYGLLAEDIEVAPDHRSVRFRLRPEARFQDASPVLAEDVKYSFDRLTGPGASPSYRQLFSDVSAVVVLDRLSVRFDFKTPGLELPLLVGSMPIFSHRWGEGKAFDKVVMDRPIASGPYRIGRMNFGRDITYERDPHYWAQQLNVRQGMFNFDHVTYKIYKDTTAQTEAFKAGEFDYIQVFRAREWARTYVGKLFSQGKLIKKELTSKNASDFQGYLINTRRPQFRDVRVRQALGLAMDFEWMNRQLFYGAYSRVQGYFSANDFQAKALPVAEELAVLEPLRQQLNPAVFDQPVPMAPSTVEAGGLRAHLLRAKTLLAEAGWTYQQGALRNAQGIAFTIEYLDGGGSEAVFAPFREALKKLGIEATYRRADFALIQKRLDNFDFDLFTARFPGEEAPGGDLSDRFGSKSAGIEGSSNLIGIRDPSVDALIQQVQLARTRPQLVTRLRALDRVLRHGYYMIPQYYSAVFRVAYRAHQFAMPSVAPSYYTPEDWIIRTWWTQKEAP